MGLGDRLRRWAFREPEAFLVTGRGGESAWEQTAARAPLCIARAPHQADLLVLAGEIPGAWREPLRALFETLPLPRAAAWLPPAWPCAAPEGLPLIDLRQGWSAVRERLLDPAAPGHRAILPDEPPSPWRGKGEHGQGGEGMMGGKPYGRPMAMTADDADQLALGDVPAALGPYFPDLPSGLLIQLRMQGDRIRAADGVENRMPKAPADPARADAALAPFIAAARGEQVPIAELERARLTSHLRWMQRLLRLAGMASLAGRVRGTAHQPAELGALFKRIEHTGLRRVLKGLGTVRRAQAERLRLRGPVTRASGISCDLRERDDGYRALDVRAQTETAGDAWARWQVRTRECLESLRLIESAGTRTSAAPETPRGALLSESKLDPPSARAMALLHDMLPGMIWSEAVLFITSLDLDMEEAALR